MEHTRQQHDARRKITRYLPQMKAGFQKDRQKFMKMNKYSGKKSDA